MPLLERGVESISVRGRGGVGVMLSLTACTAHAHCFLTNIQSLFCIQPVGTQRVVSVWYHHQLLWPPDVWNFDDDDRWGFKCIYLLVCELLIRCVGSFAPDLVHDHSVGPNVTAGWILPWVYYLERISARRFRTPRDNCSPFLTSGAAHLASMEVPWDIRSSSFSRSSDVPKPLIYVFCCLNN